MALQGTLDTFALNDVLRLLASTKKTGRLQLVTERTSGNVWVADGDVVGFDVANVASGIAGEALFELLRSPNGSFEFAAGDVPPAASASEQVEPLLVEAESRLAEWREIEAVVPSLDSWVSLRPVLPARQVTIDADLWQLIVAVGAGASVGEVGTALGLDEVPVSRAVKVLVEAGLASVDAAVSDEEEPAYDDEALANELAMLSPRAAQAVAAAALAETEEERDAALAEAVDENDQPINRNLLLKFLSSVR